MRPTQLPVQSVPWKLSPGAGLPEREAYQSIPTNVRSSLVELYLLSFICLNGVVLNQLINHRDNFTFLIRCHVILYRLYVSTDHHLSVNHSFRNSFDWGHGR
jgi:hypothetical protein